MATQKGITLVNTWNPTATATATTYCSSSKNKIKSNMVDLPGFNNYTSNELHQDVQNFQVGNLRYFSKNWYECNNNTYILDIVTYGIKLERNELSSNLAAPPILYLPKRMLSFLQKLWNYSRNKILSIANQGIMNSFQLWIPFTRNKKDRVKNLY